MGRFLAVAVTAALLLGACSNDPPADGFEGLPSPSDSPAPTASPTASAEAAGEIDVTTTPDEVTPEWVTAVVNTLLAEYGEMTAEILAMPVAEDPTLPDGFEERLDDLFEGQYLAFAQIELEGILASPAEREPLLPSEEFQGLRFDAEEVQIVDSTCIVAVGHVDRTGSAVSPPVGTTLSAVALSPSSTPPTQWEVRDVLANTNSDGEPNPDEFMLNSTLEDYGDALDHTCGGAQ